MVWKLIWTFSIKKSTNKTLRDLTENLTLLAGNTEKQPTTCFHVFLSVHLSSAHPSTYMLWSVPRLQLLKYFLLTYVPGAVRSKVFTNRKSFNLIITYYPHFTGGETETQKDDITPQGQKLSCSAPEPGLAPGSLALGSILWTRIRCCLFSGRSSASPVGAWWFSHEELRAPHQKILVHMQAQSPTSEGTLHKGT